jgi:hypothetical protein
MKYTLRFVWFVLRIVLVAVSAFTILIAAFFVAMDSANVYVIVSDGMKTRAESMLITSGPAELSNSYFTAKYIQGQSSVKAPGYEDFTITGIKYKLSVESLWCNPWKNTATVTVVESIPEMAYSASDTTSTDKKAAEPPQWQRARYKVSCVRVKDYWRIDAIEKVENLEAEPTLSPEQSSYITASPLPTTTPNASPGPSGSTAPSPSPSPKK